jgi:hypothetical protein
MFRVFYLGNSDGYSAERPYTCLFLLVRQKPEQIKILRNNPYVDLIFLHKALKTTLLLIKINTYNEPMISIRSLYGWKSITTRKQHFALEK